MSFFSFVVVVAVMLLAAQFNFATARSTGIGTRAGESSGSSEDSDFEAVYGEDLSDCSTNYTLLEGALHNTGDNLYKLTTVFFPPVRPNPFYVDVYYQFTSTDNSTGATNRTHYIWSTASLYIIVPPYALGYLSLFLGYIGQDRITNVTLLLPEECQPLMEIAVERDNILGVLTQRLQFYAQKYESTNVDLEVVFKATVVLVDNKDAEHTFQDIYSSGRNIFLSFIFVLPAMAIVLSILLAKGSRHHLRTAFTIPNNQAVVASLVCTGMAFSLLIIGLDIATIVAIREQHQEYTMQMGSRTQPHNEHNKLFNCICTLVAVEFVTFILVLAFFLAMSCDRSVIRMKYNSHPYNKLVNESQLEKGSSNDQEKPYEPKIEKIVFRVFSFVLFGSCKKVPDRLSKEIRLWLATAGLILPILCFTSHFGFILLGWATFSYHGTAIVLFYIFSFIFLFIAHKQIYRYIRIYTKFPSNPCTQGSREGSNEICDPLQESEDAKRYKTVHISQRTNRSTNDEAMNTASEEHNNYMNVEYKATHIDGFSFSSLLIVFFVGTPFLCGGLAYIGAGFLLLPIQNVIDDIPSLLFALGQYGTIAVLFIFTYTSRGRNSNSIISEDGMKYWNYIYKRSFQSKEVYLPSIVTDSDKASALEAAYFFVAMDPKQSETKYKGVKELLSKVVDQSSEDTGDPKKSETKEEDKDNGDRKKSEAEDVELRNQSSEDT